MRIKGTKRVIKGNAGRNKHAGVTTPSGESTNTSAKPTSTNAHPVTGPDQHHS